jgi:hypothetical protein
MNSEKVPGATYNPLNENSHGSAYNADLRSTTAPAATTCPSGWRSGSALLGSWCSAASTARS